jgi:predicted ATPase
MEEFVDWVRVENFRSVKRADLHLTRLHALIGPNDSGKSSLLFAIANNIARVWVSKMSLSSGPPSGIAVGTHPHVQLGASLPSEHIDYFQKIIGPRQLLRFDPDELRMPSSLIPKNHALWFQSDKGRGLASLYDAVLARDRVAFAKIDERFRVLFPTCKALRLENADSQTKTLGLTLLDGTEVSANEMSEGMLYWLAFAIVEYLQRQAMLLIEEPENGLHPSRIAEVMRVLRDVSKTTQVIIATHSPLVVNELQADEVTLVTRGPEVGTICTPLTQTKNFKQRSEVYQLGELWLSYADGSVETELVGESTDKAV